MAIRNVTNRFQGLRTRFQEILFISMKRAGMARSRSGYSLVEFLLASYRKENRPGKAWRLLNEHIVAIEDRDLTFKLAHLQMTLGMVDQSIDTFQEMLDSCILRQSEVEAPLVANLIESLNRKERYQRAVSVYESLENVELWSLRIAFTTTQGTHTWQLIGLRMRCVAMRKRLTCKNGTLRMAMSDILIFCTIWAIAITRYKKMTQRSDTIPRP